VRFQQSVEGAARDLSFSCGSGDISSNLFDEFLKILLLKFGDMSGSLGKEPT
jgi:hypothetical protein